MPEIFIKETHQGLWYEDGLLIKVVGAGRYRIPTYHRIQWWRRLMGKKRQPLIEVILVDMRERELTIKGQEILTADKVAIRVSILTQFQVTDPGAALHRVQNYEDRLYSDVQLAARRSLASMTLEDILTNRNRLSEDILKDVKESARGYGVEILRSDVKDLVFPGNLQDVMNRVLAAERLSEVQLIEARTQTQVQHLENEAAALAQRLASQTQAEIQRIKMEAEMQALQEREQVAAVYQRHPVLMRLLELEALKDVAQNANARIYFGFDRPERSYLPTKDKSLSHQA
jgi:regulator of protease activity HflC (stomatin/prohibitin superfamily)